MKICNSKRRRLSQQSKQKGTEHSKETKVSSKGSFARINSNSDRSATVSVSSSSMSMSEGVSHEDDVDGTRSGINGQETAGQRAHLMEKHCSNRLQRHLGALCTARTSLKLSDMEVEQLPSSGLVLQAAYCRRKFNVAIKYRLGSSSA